MAVCGSLPTTDRCVIAMALALALAILIFYNSLPHLCFVIFYYVNDFPTKENTG